jgi:hypothetical protein
MTDLLVLLVYALGAAATGSWVLGFGGLGRDWYDRVVLVILVLLWPLFWALAAVLALAKWDL